MTEIEKALPIFQGINHKVVRPDDFASLFADFLDTILYTQPSQQSLELTTDRTYTDNQTFWQDALRGIQFPEMRICLQDFHLTEWIPSAPGRYFTPKAIASRNKAQQYYVPEAREFLPLGKERMVLGGIGSIRLGSKVVESTPIYFLGASSTGISHQGIPVAMTKSQYRSVIAIIKEHGGCVANLVGSLRVLPASMSVVRYDTEIPRYCFFAKDVEMVRSSLEDELLTTIAIMFPSDYNVSEKDRFNKDGYTTYLQKAWSFCSFSPSSTGSLQSAVDWLRLYANRYSRIENPPILSDFDEHYQHFENPIEFSISQLFNNKIDPTRLNAYKGYYGLTVNIGRIVMGDVFENIRDSTIVNRSIVEKSFNKVEKDFDRDTAMALLRVAEEIAKSGNKEAAELFEGFNEEIQKPEPRRSVLRNIWDGIEKALPSIVQITDVVMKISKLFGN